MRNLDDNMPSGCVGFWTTASIVSEEIAITASCATNLCVHDCWLICEGASLGIRPVCFTFG